MRTAADDPEAAAHHRTGEDTDPKRFGLDPVRDIPVLYPMNRGGVCARSSMPVRKRLLDSRWTPTGDLIASKDTGALRGIALHAVDALALVHALILRLQALVLPFKALVFSSH